MRSRAGEGRRPAEDEPKYAAPEDQGVGGGGTGQPRGRRISGRRTAGGRLSLRIITRLTMTLSLLLPFDLPIFLHTSELCAAIIGCCGVCQRRARPLLA